MQPEKKRFLGPRALAKREQVVMVPLSPDRRKENWMNTIVASLDRQNINPQTEQYVRAQDLFSGASDSSATGRDWLLKRRNSKSVDIQATLLPEPALVVVGNSKGHMSGLADSYTHLVKNSALKTDLDFTMLLDHVKATSQWSKLVVEADDGESDLAAEISRHRKLMVKAGVRKDGRGLDEKMNAATCYAAPSERTSARLSSAYNPCRA